MMESFVPRKTHARVPMEKLVDYLLNERHPQGAGKARFFRMCGYDSTNADRLAEDLRQLVLSVPVSTTRETPFGIHYVVEGPISTPSGRTVQVATVWLIEEGTETPQLITAYPGSVKG